MKTEKIVTIVFLAFFMVAVGALVWLAQAPIMPPMQKVEQAIADDRIPH
jgi:phage shock protein PspC (stress-responsive transcriptional regulator)